MNGVTFEYANSVKVCPVDVFWRYDLWGQPIVFAIALRKRSLDKGVLPTGVYSSSCDILIVALMLTSKHTSWGVGISLPGFCVYSLFVVWFPPTCPHSWDRWGTLSVTEAHENLKKKKKSHFTQWVQLSPKDKKFSPGKNSRFSRLPCPPPGDLLNPVFIEPQSLSPPALTCGFFTTGTTWGAPLKYTVLSKLEIMKKASCLLAVPL